MLFIFLAPLLTCFHHFFPSRLPHSPTPHPPLQLLSVTTISVCATLPVIAVACAPFLPLFLSCRSTIVATVCLLHLSRRLVHPHRCSRRHRRVHCHYCHSCHIRRCRAVPPRRRRAIDSSTPPSRRHIRLCTTYRIRTPQFRHAVRRRRGRPPAASAQSISVFAATTGWTSLLPSSAG